MIFKEIAMKSKEMIILLKETITLLLEVGILSQEWITMLLHLMMTVFFYNNFKKMSKKFKNLLIILLLIWKHKWRKEWMLLLEICSMESLVKNLKILAKKNKREQIRKLCDFYEHLIILEFVLSYKIRY